MFCGRINIVKKRKIYKALMVDVDGTLINSEKSELISKKVKQAIIRSQLHISIVIASGRPLERVSFVFDELELVKPCIIGGGAQIVDPKTHKILWERPILDQDMPKILNIFKHLNEPILALDDKKESFYNGSLLKKPMGFYIPEIETQKADAIIQQLSQNTSLSLHKAVAYKPGHVALHITHAEANKNHATLKVAELLSLKSDAIIGIGDGYNDFPLFLACGLRIAVENGIDELKRRADYVAPSVTNDGVAHVIEKFVLPQTVN